MIRRLILNKIINYEDRDGVIIREIFRGKMNAIKEGKIFPTDQRESMPTGGGERGNKGHWSNAVVLDLLTL